MEPRFYSHTPETPLSNKILCILLGIVVVFLLAFVHGIVNAINPIIYLGIVATIGFGLIFGILYRVISKIARVRDSNFIVFSGIGVMVLGMYFSWSAYLLNLYGELMQYFPNVGLLDTPGWVFRRIQELYTYGSWGLSNDSTISGLPLLAVWIVEAIIILYTTFRILKGYEIAPFSQRFNKWYIKYKLHDEYQSLADAQMFYDMEGNTLSEKIGNLGKGKAMRYGRVSLFMLANAGDAYLLYENVGRDSKGKKETATTVIDHLIIPRTEAETLIKKYYGKKEFYFEY